MEKGEFIPLLWFFLSFGLMFISTNFIPPPLGTYLGGGSIFIMIPGLMIQEWALKSLLSSTNHLNATIKPRSRPQNLDCFPRKFDLYFKAPLPQDSVPIGDPDLRRFLTPIKLRWPIQYYEFKKIDRVYIRHNLPWAVRIKLGDGFAYYAGMLIKHSQTDNVVLKEYSDVFWDHARPYPVFELAYGGGVEEQQIGIIKKYLTTAPELTIMVRASEPAK